MKSVKVFLDTSGEVAIFRVDEREYRFAEKYELAEKLLAFMRDCLAESGAGFKDISEISFMAGPGSFTGLRIGAAVVNTLAHELSIPLYDQNGVLREVIIPDYGRDANISAPRK